MGHLASCVKCCKVPRAIFNVLCYLLMPGIGMFQKDKNRVKWETAFFSSSTFHLKLPYLTLKLKLKTSKNTETGSFIVGQRAG
jgi:hypothetical protein